LTIQAFRKKRTLKDEVDVEDRGQQRKSSLSPEQSPDFRPTPTMMNTVNEFYSSPSQKKPVTSRAKLVGFWQTPKMYSPPKRAIKPTDGSCKQLARATSSNFHVETESDEETIYPK